MSSQREKILKAEIKGYISKRIAKHPFNWQKRLENFRLKNRIDTESKYEYKLKGFDITKQARHKIIDFYYAILTNKSTTDRAEQLLKDILYAGIVSKESPSCRILAGRGATKGEICAEITDAIMHTFDMLHKIDQKLEITRQSDKDSYLSAIQKILSFALEEQAGLFNNDFVDRLNKFKTKVETATPLTKSLTYKYFFTAIFDVLGREDRLEQAPPQYSGLMAKEVANYILTMLFEHKEKHYKPFERLRIDDTKKAHSLFYQHKK